MDPLTPALLDALADFRPKDLTDAYYRQTPPPRAALDVLPTAQADGRWHREGGSSPAYLADSALGALLEQAHHTIWEPGDKPILEPRRVTRLQATKLPYLDLLSDASLARLGFTPDELRADSAYSLCQALALAAWDLHPTVGALLVPSAPAQGRAVLVVHQRAFAYLKELDSRIQQLAPQDVTP